MLAMALYRDIFDVLNIPIRDKHSNSNIPIRDDVLADIGLNMLYGASDCWHERRAALEFEFHGKGKSGFCSRTMLVEKYDVV